ncbi:hypothetical protein LINGRAHAP2_LOCUS34214 [Linum grandiflorum]
MQEETSAAAAVSFCPSFSSYSCDRLADVAAAAVTAASDDDGFEFACLANTVPEEGGPLSSPVFPVFNRDLLHGDELSAETELRSLSELFLDDRDPQGSFSSSSSEAGDLEGAPEGSYCFWTPKSIMESSVIGASPSPGRCVKSNSTGSSSSTTKRRWRLRDLLRRSSSDGKAVSHLLVNPSSGSSDEVKLGKKVDEKAKKPPLGAGKVTRTGAGKQASPHELFYRKSKAMREGDKRRSYLPYRQDLVGFFSTANGFTRTFTPF